MTHASSSHRASFWLCVIGLIGIGVYSLTLLRQTSALYDGVLAMNATQNAGSVAKAKVPGSEKTLNIPSWSLFRSGEIWSLASKTNPLPHNFQAPSLIATSLAHGDSGDPMQVQKRIEQPLKQLFDAAEQDGIELMLSSAYRSIEDQKQLYSDFVAKQGAAMAALYVAKPGTSEHHTGLAIDFASASGACEENSDSCSLSQAAAAWLVKNASRFGFIQRYPEGAQPITGVAYEPWHYRYVGIPMAKAVSASNLTYDEIVRQIARGYTK